MRLRWEFRFRVGKRQTRVLDASTSPNPVNVVVDGETVASNVPYPMCVYEICQTLSAYATVKSGGVSFALEAPSDPTNVAPSQFQKLNLASNTQSTFVLGPPTSFAVNAPNAGYLILDDDVPAANAVKIRIANVDPTGPALLSAFILPAGTSPSGDPTISNVALGTASNYVTVPPGSYNVWFVIQEPSLGAPSSPYTPWGPTTYPANQNFTVYLMQELDIFRGVILADN
jgi:Domain of unknown function (DUF4397)